MTDKEKDAATSGVDFDRFVMLPCKKCGSTRLALGYFIADPFTGCHGRCVVCFNCDAKGPDRFGEQDDEIADNHARQAWNEHQAT